MSEPRSSFPHPDTSPLLLTAPCMHVPFFSAHQNDKAGVTQKHTCIWKVSAKSKHDCRQNFYKCQRSEQRENKGEKQKARSIGKSLSEGLETSRESTPETSLPLSAPVMPGCLCAHTRGDLHVHI